MGLHPREGCEAVFRRGGGGVINCNSTCGQLVFSSLNISFEQLPVCGIAYALGNLFFVHVCWVDFLASIIVSKTTVGQDDSLRNMAYTDIRNTQVEQRCVQLLQTASHKK